MWNINKIIKKGEYNYVLVPEHPNKTSNGYVLEHRIVMENELRRLLKSNEIVHHKDGNKKNNDIHNLEVMTHSEHTILHNQTGRQMVILMCPQCNIIFSREKRKTFLSKNGIFTCCSRKCNGLFCRNIQMFGRTKYIETLIARNVVLLYRDFTLKLKKEIS